MQVKKKSDSTQVTHGFQWYPGTVIDDVVSDPFEPNRPAEPDPTEDDPGRMKIFPVLPRTAHLYEGQARQNINEGDWVVFSTKTGLAEVMTPAEFEAQFEPVDE